MTKPSFRPSSFMLIPTAACQASCIYCFGPNRGETMPLSVVDKSLEFMARIAPDEGNVNVTFHGGEPLLAGYEYYAYVLARLEALFGRRLRLSIQTNLLAMDERMAQIIHDWRISVGTSVDGDEAMCDAQRGEGYYARNEMGRSMLRRKGVDASRICTFTHQSAEEAERVFYHYAGEAPLTGISYAIHGAVRALGRKPDVTTVTAEDMTRLLLDTLAVYRDNITQTHVNTLDTMVKGCFDNQGHVCTFFPCLGRFAAIAPDGRVYSCQRFCGHADYALGSVLNDLNETQIVDSAAYKMLLGKQDGAREACGNCMHFSYCNGGCLYNMCASDAEKDPYCAAYKAAFDVISRDMALEMGGIMTKRIVPENAPLLQMAGDLPHPYDLALNEQRMRQAASWGRYPYGASQTLDRFKRNRLSERNKLYLHMTFDCPLRCSHCYASGGETRMNEMPANAALGIVYEAQRALFRAVVITGGEPLIHSEIDEFLSGLKQIDLKGMRLILRTSLGFAIEAQRLRAACEAFPEIVVSVDGNEESHDARRGTGRYVQTVANLERIRDMGLISRVGVCATLPKAQREGKEGAAVDALCEKLGITNIRFRSVLPLGRASDATPDESFICIDESETKRTFRPRFTCGLGQNLYVEPDGGAYPCYAWCGKDKWLGNVVSDGLDAILHSEAFHELSRHDVDTNEKCRTCEVRYFCGGICKAWAADKANIDSGEFDCEARKAAYRHLADMLKV